MPTGSRRPGTKTSGSNPGRGLVAELRAVAAQRGLDIVAEYIDEGVSGATTSRPSFDAMMRAAQEGKFEHLLVWKLDRLGRSLPHLLNSLDLLAGWGVSFCSVREPGIDTTSAHGRLLLQLLAVFASHERELIKERVTAGVRRAQAAGRHVGRPRASSPSPGRWAPPSGASPSCSNPWRWPLSAAWPTPIP